MDELILICNYKDNDEYRLSFNQLATDTFGIDFEPWYKKGFWNERYICYSYWNGDKIVANVSVNKMDIIWEGQSKSALQIGTVMTDPDYRKRGLSSKLMNIVLEEFENEYDFIYLFANATVFDFYPKFGFTELKENEFTMDINIQEPSHENIRKLNIEDKNDLNIIERLATNRKPISKILGVSNNQHLILFYCTYVFCDDIYYIEEKDTIIIFQNEDGTMNIYDIICENEVDINDILDKVAPVGTKKVQFHFTPDYKDIKVDCSSFDLDYKLFIRPISEDIKNKFIFPYISHA